MYVDYSFLFEEAHGWYDGKIESRDKITQRGGWMGIKLQAHGINKEKKIKETVEKGGGLDNNKMEENGWKTDQWPRLDRTLLRIALSSSSLGIIALSIS